MKKGKALALFGAALLVGGVAYAVTRSKKDEESFSQDGNDEAPEVSVEKISPIRPSTGMSSSFPISFGTSRNKNVITLQNALKVNADGIWGNQTETALKRANLGGVTIKSAAELTEVVSKIKNFDKDGGNPFAKAWTELANQYNQFKKFDKGAYSPSPSAVYDVTVIRPKKDVKMLLVDSKGVWSGHVYTYAKDKKMTFNSALIRPMAYKGYANMIFTDGKNYFKPSDPNDIQNLYVDRAVKK